MTTQSEETLKDVSKAVSDAVNVMGRGERKLAEALLNDHRTLIQRKAVVFLLFFRMLAEERFDERDEAAHRLAVVIRDAADAAGFGDDLPFI